MNDFDLTKKLFSSSDLVKWLHEHQRELLNCKKISWKTLSSILEEQNVRNKNGEPFSKETIRRTWYRLKKSKFVLNEQQLKSSNQENFQTLQPINKPNTGFKLSKLREDK